MRWVPHERILTAQDGALPPFLARSGHTAVYIRPRSLVVIFGGLVDKKFLGDCFAFDCAAGKWFVPPTPSPATLQEAEASAPPPRAFHCAASSGGNMFVFGGRSGRTRLADFWMLDTESWQWVQLPCSGATPSARDFASLVAFEKYLVLFGGWDGTKFYSDTYVLEIASLEWTHIEIPPVVAAIPAARCGHTATAVEKRMLLFGGRGMGGSMLGDLWALKGFAPAAAFGDEQQTGQPPEAATWTHLALPGRPPASRCGHALAAARTQLVVFGGHSQGGWLARVDTYLNDCVVLDRATAQWRVLAVTGQPLPEPRAYHTFTCVGQRFLCIGGFDGKNTFGDAWWLLPPDDPWTKADEEMEARGHALRLAAATLAPSRPVGPPERGTAALVPPAPSAPQLTAASHEEALQRLRLRLGVEAAEPSGRDPGSAEGLERVATAWRPGDEVEGGARWQEELQALGARVLSASLDPGAAQGEAEGGDPRAPPQLQEAGRGRLARTPPHDLTLTDIPLLFADYRCQVAVAHWRHMRQLPGSPEVSRFYHLTSSDELRLADVAALQAEYRNLLEANGEPS